MMAFSADPQVAEQQMHAIIFYLTTFGYIDGEFDLSEKRFVRDYIRTLIERRVESAQLSDSALARELTEKYTSHFHEVFEHVDLHVRSLFTEAVAKDEDVETFVYAKLKLRCFEIFKSFDEDNQQNLMSTVDALIAADGVTHPSEAQFRRELNDLLSAEIVLEIDDILPSDTGRLQVDEPASLAPGLEDHPFFQRMEQHYSKNPDVIRQQAAADYQLIQMTMAKFEEQRAVGKGKLNGKQSVAELASEAPFLDGHIYVLPPLTGRAYELVVLGDMHGCYSCLKGALMQSNFFAKVEAFRQDPVHNPDVKLVLLGDYIDRGHYSYNGVLRAVMQLFLTAPEHVYILRGNHEYYLEYKGKIYGGVRPAEAIHTLEGHMPQEMFQAYMKLFESMPNMLLFDRTLFVHAGIPRDELLAERWKDLSSLNDSDIRFQMLWSDPSEADFIPPELQKQNARFPFGRKQFRSFMARVGTNTMVRGHEKIDAGFKKVYDDGTVLLLNLFSAGGKTNDDLPPESSYRTVTPMALTIKYAGGQQSATPWEIDYETFNVPERNAFFRAPPEIEFKSS
jgi:hypothetical protein